MATRLRLLLRLARLAALLTLGGLLGATVALLQHLQWLHRCELQGLRQQLSRWLLRRLSRALPYRLHLHGRLPAQPMLWVSNHVSWCDIVLLGQLAPLSFLAKAELRDWPLLGWLARQAGTLFIQRGAGQTSALQQQISRQLSAGRGLLLFPEGTTYDGSRLGRFHPRLFAAAGASGVPVQPVAIRYRRAGQPCRLAPFIGDAELPGHLLTLLGAAVADVDIHLLPPLTSQGASRDQLAWQAAQAIAARLELSAAPARLADLA